MQPNRKQALGFPPFKKQFPPTRFFETRSCSIAQASPKLTVILLPHLSKRGIIDWPPSPSLSVIFVTYFYDKARDVITLLI